MIIQDYVRTNQVRATLHDLGSNALKQHSIESSLPFFCRRTYCTISYQLAKVLMLKSGFLLIVFTATTGLHAHAQTPTGNAAKKNGAAQTNMSQSAQGKSAAATSSSLTQSQLWALACTGVLTEKNHESHDILWASPATEVNIRNQKRALSESWNINSRDDLLRQLNSLIAEGHRKSFDEMAKIAQTPGLSNEVIEKLAHEHGEDSADRLRIAREYGTRLGMRSIIGFDYCRYIALCRWGTLCSYLSQDEAWAKIMPIAQALQNTFPSWKELGENYLIGRKFWQPNSDSEPAINAAYRKLLTDPQSPWVKIPWNTKLTAASTTK